MNLEAYTITRFVDKLLKRGLIERKEEGRVVSIFPTVKGIHFKTIIEQALGILHDLYADDPGAEFTQKLSSEINFANQKLNQ